MTNDQDDDKDKTPPQVIGMNNDKSISNNFIDKNENMFDHNKH